MPGPERTLELTGYERISHELAYTAEIAGHSFTTRFRWDSIDLLELEGRHGEELLRTLYFHAIAFDLVRLVSLKPDTVDFGPFRDLVTQEFTELWRRILEGVWAQWRYENDLPGWPGPRILGRRRARASSAARAADPRDQRATTTPAKSDGGVRRGGLSPSSQTLSPLSTESDGGVRRGGLSPSSGDPAPTMLFCGGGKDSLLAAKLFEELGEPFDAFAYSHSLYGGDAMQHELIDRLLDHCAPRRRHRLRIFDDLRPAELDLGAFGVRTFTAAETPSALFLALPLALGHGFRNLVVAHERSADRGNLVWSATGEEVNHQWGKSLAAEALLGDYVERRLLADVRYFSALKPVPDAVIFPALSDYASAVPDTHSCNVAKPWCRRCAKCVYVFLGCAAWLPRTTVEATFGENLFDVADNLGRFARLLGLAGHLPFECVGTIEESRLFLALAARGGWGGVAIDRFRAVVEDPPAAVLAELFEIRGRPHRIPAPLAARLLPALELRARVARLA